MKSVVLKVEGHIPFSFKNRKMAVRDNQRIGKLKSVLPPKLKKRMKALEDAFVFALISEYQRTIAETQTACSLASWIASSTPDDDCWQAVPEINVMVYRAYEPVITMTIEPL